MLMYQQLPILLIMFVFSITMDVNAEQTSPSSRLIEDHFLEIEQGTVLQDTKTGIYWMRCLVGQVWNAEKKRCEGPALFMSGEQALKLKANFAGRSDWRVPTITEYRTILHCVSLEADRQEDWDWRSSNCKEGFLERSFPGTSFAALWVFNAELELPFHMTPRAIDNLRVEQRHSVQYYQLLPTILISRGNDNDE